VSLDRGDSWFKWTHGLPTVPVRALRVHPRDHDLVIGTHGRALWVLDDIRPLRALAQDPGLTEEPLHLFETPKAFLRHTAAVDGYHFAGDALFRGEGRPAGALLTYWVGAELGDSVEITVTSAGGDAVRTFRGPGGVGLNRVVWDLREDPLGGTDDAGGGGRSGAGAPEVLPGTYTVRVSAGDASTTRSLTVEPDPRVEVPMVDRVEKYEAIRSGLDLERRLRAAQSAAQEIRDALGRILEGLADRDDDTAVEIRDGARALERALATASSDAEVSRYRRSVRTLDGSYDRPTEGQRLDLERMGRRR